MFSFIVCGNGKLIIEHTNMNFPDKSHVDVLDVGFVDSIEECAVNCVNPTNFFCNAVQVYHFVNDGVTKLLCKLLSETANNSSYKFISYSGSNSKIYNVHCECKYISFCLCGEFG